MGRIRHHLWSFALTGWYLYGSYLGWSMCLPFGLFAYSHCAGTGILLPPLWLPDLHTAWYDAGQLTLLTIGGAILLGQALLSLIQKVLVMAKFCCCRSAHPFWGPPYLPRPRPTYWKTLRPLTLETLHTHRVPDRGIGRHPALYCGCRDD